MVCQTWYAQQPEAEQIELLAIVKGCLIRQIVVHTLVNVIEYQHVWPRMLQQFHLVVNLKIWNWKIRRNDSKNYWELYTRYNPLWNFELGKDSDRQLSTVKSLQLKNARRLCWSKTVDIPVQFFFLAEFLQNKMFERSKIFHK